MAHDDDAVMTAAEEIEADARREHIECEAEAEASQEWMLREADKDMEQRQP